MNASAFFRSNPSNRTLAPTNWSKWIRQTHRWLSIVFTLTVIANFVQLARGGGNPPNWVTYSPLPPLALQLLTGLYLFVLPYVAKRRSGGQTDVRGTVSE